jgi:hypothetical protein
VVLKTVVVGLVMVVSVTSDDTQTRGGGTMTCFRRRASIRFEVSVLKSSDISSRLQAYFESPEIYLK